jgi:hypothetical protein
MVKMGLDNTRVMHEEFFGRHPSLLRSQPLKVSDFFSDDSDEWTDLNLKYKKRNYQNFSSNIEEAG